MTVIRLFVVLPLLVVACKTAPPAAEPSAPTLDSQQIAHVPDIRGEEVIYEAGGVELKGYLAWDANLTGPRPGVLVVHEWWGHNEYVRKRARMLAELGYTALAVDMYGGGKLAEHPEDAQRFSSEVAANMDTGQARFEAGLELLRGHPRTDPERIAAVGYCFGGAIVVEMARRGVDLRGVASFHPGSLATTTPVKPGTIHSPIIVFIGEDDPFLSAEQRRAFKQEMEDAQVALDWVSYPGVAHSFTVPGATAHGQRTGLPLAYDAAADAESWARLQSFLETIL